ncbi:DUF1090 domain-containing protein [soil metagenome]
MNRSSMVFCVAAVLAAASSAHAAEPSPACAAKRLSIENEIAYANQHGQKQRLAGLATALRKNQTHCSDASLQADRKAAIAKAEREVKQRQADLAMARQKGDQAKVSSRQAKLDTARAELVEAQKPIN